MLGSLHKQGKHTIIRCSHLSPCIHLETPRLIPETLLPATVSWLVSCKLKRLHRVSHIHKARFLRRLTQEVPVAMLSLSSEIRCTSNSIMRKHFYSSKGSQQ
ncbi:hypothetical protein M758_UG111000 [Ceratodon purpureus]|nr:hypothetical protein M758_UG111000 [Ceratodon purpureus]